MSVKLRLALLLGALLAVFLVILQCLRVVERAKVEEIHRESYAINELSLNSWIDLTNQPLKRFALDFGQWQTLYEFSNRADAPWEKAQIQQNLANYEAHAAWVYDANDQVVYSAQANPGPRLSPPPGALAWARRKDALPGESYFSESRDGLLEIWSVPIKPPENPGPASGHFVVGRLWDARHLARLAQLTEASLVLAPVEAAPVKKETVLQVDRPLADRDGNTLRILQARFPDPDFSSKLARDANAVRLMVGFCVLVILALWLAVRRWILQPLDCIGESLTRGDPAGIMPLLSGKNELARIARLVESSFAQKSELGREIEQHRLTEAALRESESHLVHSLELRARLARDLHDGVIQSIYAAGLGLERALTEMENDGAGARGRLQFCRQSLNEIIRDVRGFINGIEPENLARRDFAQELTALTRSMRDLWQIPVNLQVDPAAAARLTPAQELHALQISRECISNAARHGGATAIDIRLGGEAGSGFLTIRDNGCGFDFLASQGGGRGLKNLESRATEMGGSIKVDSVIGRGTAITVSFNLESLPS
jgi:signal transduction histidine kinase